MLWIIWTCAWWFVVTAGLLMDAKRYSLSGKLPQSGAVGFECLVLIAIWVIGMVKFWNV